MWNMRVRWAFGIILFVGFMVIQHEVKKPVSVDGGFGKTIGTHFLMNGRHFYMNGFNAYWLMYMASDPSLRGNVTSAFQQASGYGMTMARTWAFRDGGYKPLQIKPGVYDKIMFQVGSSNHCKGWHGAHQMNCPDFAPTCQIRMWGHLQGLDFMISEAKKYGIYLILCLANNYPDLGGRKQYVKWATQQGQSLTSDDDFYTNNVVKGFYKNHVKAVLTRMNTFTGVAYKDDPTIFAWELINEPRCESDLSGNTLQDWIAEMAAFVKSIDSNHLLEVGLEGFYGESKKQSNPGGYQFGTDFISNNQIPEIDFATLHAYPDQWLADSSEEDRLNFLHTWSEAHIQDSFMVLKKPLLLTEFGKSSKASGYTIHKRDAVFETHYDIIYSSANSGGPYAGGLFWQLLDPRMDYMRDGFEVIILESPSTANIIAQQSKKLSALNR